MTQLKDLVLSTVQDFVNNNVLFTALDVSNVVKNTLPLARHREIRDLVRQFYTPEMETEGYIRTPIAVTLFDGSVVNALLYHPIADSWDLDSKYDAQKRAALNATATQIASTPIMPPPTTTTVPIPVITSNVDLWSNLLQNQSLFSK